MVSEQKQPEDLMPVLSTADPPARKHGVLMKIFTGALVSFAVLSLLYGVNQAALLVAVAVICSAGLGLIPLLFLSWLVGWVVLEIVDAIAERTEPASVQ